MRDFVTKSYRFGVGIALCLVACGGGSANAQDKVPLPITLPKAVFAGTASNEMIPPTVEKLTGKPRPIPLVPKGTINLALHRKVTSSSAPFSGSLDMITDGIKEARDDTVVELKPRLQWVQIDLGAVHPLFYVAVWHYHQVPVVFHCVIVQVSNDPRFIDGVTTLFNNDADNSAGLGIGKDREYIETNEGKLIDAKGIKARYVRLYSKGSIFRDPLNRYTEVEVYGLPTG
ncbi:MAG TPA: hypothetical protein VGS41_14445 [Chthonomonadales bacterium]|nr:hypothetical protein [Chthonomonadales bacterium]